MCFRWFFKEINIARPRGDQMVCYGHVIVSWYSGVRVSVARVFPEVVECMESFRAI